MPVEDLETPETILCLRLYVYGCPRGTQKTD